MNKLARWGVALAFLPLAACNSNPTNPFASTLPLPQTLPTVSATDQKFAMQAAGSDMFEIESSKLALQRSRNPRTRAFAEKMIADHTQSSQKLAALAQAKGIVLPTAMDPEQSRMLTAIDNTRRIFDQEYFRQQGIAHDTAVTIYQGEINNGYDADIRGFAQQTLPVIQDHLSQANQMRGRDMTRRPAAG